MIASLTPLKAVRIHGGQQEQVHALHNPLCSLIRLFMLTQPLCQRQQ